MKNTPIRFLVILGGLSMVSILVVQIYWVNQAINKQEEQFNHSVQMALREVVESLCKINGNDIPSNDPIDQVSKNYFIARTNYRIDLNSLDYLLKAELQKKDIELDYEYGVYDCQTDRMVYGDFVSFEKSEVSPRGVLPKLEEEEYYFGVYFPGKAAGIVNSLGFWKVTSALTLIIMLSFSYALFVILRQKRFSEIQRDFINNMTHELKTPLSTLQVAADVLESEASSERNQKYSGIIKAETRRLQLHVQHLLETALMDHSGKGKKERFDPKPILEHLIGQFEGKTRMFDSEINFTEIRLVGDPIIFETMVFNLLDNACKYGQSYVLLKCATVDHKLEIEVTNDGLKIPKKEQKRIFQKFYRIGSGDLHDVKGFGLGLYFVKQGAQSMKGSVSVTSKDKHTSFTLKLPVSHA